MIGHFVMNSYSQGTKLWGEYINYALLAPYGLDADQPLSEALFYAKPDHMQLIVSAAVKNAKGMPVPVEVTPVGVGARASVDEGDAYVLPPASFGRKAHAVTRGNLWADQDGGFTLGDMHAVTSSNFAHVQPVFWDVMSLMGMGAPSFNWLTINLASGELKQSDYLIVDSGPEEYLGLMPLLARGMRKIVAFVNTDIPIVKGEHVVGLEKVLPSYFGIIPDEDGIGREYQVAKPAVAESGCKPYCLKNQVFADTYYQALADNYIRQKWMESRLYSCRKTYLFWIMQTMASKVEVK